MKRKSYAELTAEVARLQSAESLLQITLHLVNNTRPNATERAHLDGGRYVFNLYGAERASGGIVTKTYHYRRQTPQTREFYLDSMLSRMDSFPAPFAAAIDRLRIARDRILDASAVA